MYNRDLPHASFHDLAREVLDSCLASRSWPASALERLLSAAASPDEELARQASSALFQVVAEGLADLFDPELSETYAALFSRVLAAGDPSLRPEELVARYLRLRRIRPFAGDTRRVKQVVVLSRVTLGADIAVTSVVLAAAKKRFPDAEILLAGGEKSRDLFAADARVGWLPVSYGRGGTLRERLAAGRELAEALRASEGIVIDPDSRLTQLGLLPVCPEEDYSFFDSRSYGGAGDDSITALTQRWVGEVFGVSGAQPYTAPLSTPDAETVPAITVNLGVGGNPAKRVPDPFERELLSALARKGLPVVVDLGAGGEEEERVRSAASGLGNVRTWRGPFAALVARIARSRLYVGYDSAGQHAAAASGTPLVTVFAGFPSPRMLARWSPTGPGHKEVIRVDRPEAADVLERTLAAVDRLIPGRAA